MDSRKIVKVIEKVKENLKNTVRCELIFPVGMFAWSLKSEPAVSDVSFDKYS